MQHLAAQEGVWDCGIWQHGQHLAQLVCILAHEALDPDTVQLPNPDTVLPLQVAQCMHRTHHHTGSAGVAMWYCAV